MPGASELRGCPPERPGTPFEGLRRRRVCHFPGGPGFHGVGHRSARPAAIAPPAQREVGARSPLAPPALCTLLCARRYLPQSPHDLALPASVAPEACGTPSPLSAGVAPEACSTPRVAPEACGT